jgi:hypothetical protein
MKLQIRLIFAVLIALASFAFAIYMTAEWFKHEMPIYTSAYSHGNKPEVLPFLGFALMSFGVFFIALLDCYVHTRGQLNHIAKKSSSEKTYKKIK